MPAGVRECARVGSSLLAPTGAPPPQRALLQRPGGCQRSGRRGLGPAPLARLAGRSARLPCLEPSVKTLLRLRAACFCGGREGGGGKGGGQGRVPGALRGRRGVASPAPRRPRRAPPIANRERRHGRSVRSTIVGDSATLSSRLIPRGTPPPPRRPLRWWPWTERQRAVSEPPTRSPPGPESESTGSTAGSRPGRSRRTFLKSSSPAEAAAARAQQGERARQ